MGADRGRCFLMLIFSGSVLANGCMPIPARYGMPPRTYAPRVEHLSVTGFDREVFKQTSGGGSYASWGGQQNASANVRAYGAAVGPDVTAYGAARGSASSHAQWGGVAASRSWGGYYETVTDVSEFKRHLENTRCVRALSLDPPQSGGTYLVGDVKAWQHDGAGRHVLNTFLALTVGLFGFPGQHVVYAHATAREFRGDTFIREHAVSVRFPYWVTLYTFRSDDEEALGTVRQMAIRDLAEAVAGNMCGTG